LDQTTSLREAATRLAQEDNVFFSEEFLLPPPLLTAIMSDEPVVLLIDEIDRADVEFEAFLLEVLSDFQVTVPELGTIVAKHQPMVLLTSNNTRELSEALKRRCLFLYVDYPSYEAELNIVRLKVPNLAPRTGQTSGASGARTAQHEPTQNAQHQRNARLGARPGHPQRQQIDQKTLSNTLTVLLKYETDVVNDEL
jgi:MoxR-like ATPase